MCRVCASRISESRLWTPVRWYSTVFSLPARRAHDRRGSILGSRRAECWQRRRKSEKSNTTRRIYKRVKRFECMLAEQHQSAYERPGTPCTAGQRVRAFPGNASNVHGSRGQLEQKRPLNTTQHTNQRFASSS